MSGANEICRMNALTLAKRIRAKELSPTEVIEAVLTRMEALQPHLHAFCTPTPDLARQEAKRIEKALLANEEAGPLLAFRSESRIWFVRQECVRSPDPLLIRTLYRMKTMLLLNG